MVALGFYKKGKLIYAVLYVVHMSVLQRATEILSIEPGLIYQYIDTRPFVRHGYRCLDVQNMSSQFHAACWLYIYLPMR